MNNRIIKSVLITIGICTLLGSCTTLYIRGTYQRTFDEKTIANSAKIKSLKGEYKSFKETTDNTITALTMQNLEYESINNKMREDLDLLYMLKQSGFIAITLEDVNKFLAIISEIPRMSPFDGGHRVTSKYGPRALDWYEKDGDHGGVDIAPLEYDPKKPIMSTVEGIITDMGYSEVYGKYVEITSGNFLIKFGHMSMIKYQNIETKSVIGERVYPGTIIGLMGQSGIATGPHLHYEIQLKDAEGNYTKLNAETILEPIIR